MRVYSRLLILLSVCLVGCAQTSDRLALQPPIARIATLAADRALPTVQLTVSDERSGSLITTLQPLFAEPLPIHLREDAMATLKERLQRALETQGYRVGVSDLSWQVSLSELTVTLGEQAVMPSTEVGLALRVILTRPGERWLRDYRSRVERRSAQRPNLEQLETTVNELLAQTLERMLADRELQQWLQTPTR